MPIQTWGSSNGPRQSAIPAWDWSSVPTLTADQLAPVQMPAFNPGMPSFTAGPAVGGDTGGGSSMFGDFGKSIGGWMNDSGFLGKKMANGDQVQGWGMPVIGAAQGLANAYMGYKALSLEKDKLNENKRQFEMNWGAQQKMTNSRLEDRQRARIASNSSAYQSVGDYMKKNGI